MTYKNKWFLILHPRHNGYLPAKITRHWKDHPLEFLNARFLDIKTNKLEKVTMYLRWNQVCSVSPYWQEFIDKYEYK